MPEAPERRLAAILAADMVGYSQLIERDEAGTVARLKADRGELIDPTIVAHGGRIVRAKRNFGKMSKLSFAWASTWGTFSPRSARSRISSGQCGSGESA